MKVEDAARIMDLADAHARAQKEAVHQRYGSRPLQTAMSVARAVVKARRNLESALLELVDERPTDS